MKLVIFGLSVSSAWGNGHATLWRGLIRALARDGHRVVFFERDVPWYAAHRDFTALPDATLVLYDDWTALQPAIRRHLADADVGMVTSYCPDGVAASRWVLDAGLPRTVFYDLDTPVTLSHLDAGEPVSWLPPEGLGGFDLVLSYTGGRALDALRDRLGARVAAPLYGQVDPDCHRRGAPQPWYQADLSYLGTYAADRQATLEALFLEPARRALGRRFLIGGAQYPADFPWTPNLYFVNHVPPSDHGAFYASSPLTLSVTRGPMREMGFCPSGRLFEAAACGTPVLTDAWEGLEAFFAPGDEILVARGPDDVLAALDLGPEALAALGRRARERVLSDHTADVRARELLGLLERVPERATGR